MGSCFFYGIIVETLAGLAGRSLGAGSRRFALLRAANLTLDNRMIKLSRRIPPAIAICALLSACGSQIACDWQCAVDGRYSGNSGFLNVYGAVSETDRGFIISYEDYSAIFEIPEGANAASLACLDAMRADNTSVYIDIDGGALRELGAAIIHASQTDCIFEYSGVTFSRAS